MFQEVVEERREKEARMTELIAAYKTLEKISQHQLSSIVI